MSTVRSAVRVEGVGLHTGEPVTVELVPRDNSGIAFTRIDLAARPIIPASIDFADTTARRTALVRDGVEVVTIEHLLAACFGHGIDALDVHINAAELPIGDGSTGIWSDAIRRAGIMPGAAHQHSPVTLEPLTVSDGAASVSVAPAEYWSVRFEGVFPDGSHQSAEWTAEADFATEFADARTFAPLSQIIALRRDGMIRGGSLETSIVCVDMAITDELRRDVATFWPEVPLRVTDEGLLEPQKQCWSNEFARHKLVDLLGDLMLGSMYPGGRFAPVRIVARGSGHVLNRRFVRAVVDAHQ